MVVSRQKIYNNSIDTKKIAPDTIVPADIDETQAYNFSNTTSTFIGAVIGNDSSTIHGSVTGTISITAGGSIASVGNHGELSVQIGSDNSYRYADILGAGTDGATVSVWTPTSGSAVHIIGMMVSLSGAGFVTILEDSSTLMKLLFNEKKAVPLPMASDVEFDADVVLKAEAKADSGNVNAHISAFGHEF